jgi:hypothetical protein
MARGYIHGSKRAATPRCAVLTWKPQCTCCHTPAGLAWCNEEGARRRTSAWIEVALRRLLPLADLRKDPACFLCPEFLPKPVCQCKLGKERGVWAVVLHTVWDQGAKVGTPALRRIAIRDIVLVLVLGACTCSVARWLVILLGPGLGRLRVGERGGFREDVLSLDASLMFAM